MLSNKAIRAAFIISLGVHCLLLGMPGFNLPVLQDKDSKEIIIGVEIENPQLLPKTDVMTDINKLNEIIEKQEEFKVNPEQEFKTEEVAMKELPKELIKENIETIGFTQKTMLCYQNMVKQRIEEARRYPSWAKRREIEGVVYLSFTVLSSGLSRDIQIIRSSGKKILDEEAVATIKRANPFPPIPKEISSSSIRMEVYIVFSLK